MPKLWCNDDMVRAVQLPVHRDGMPKGEATRCAGAMRNTRDVQYKKVL